MFTLIRALVYGSLFVGFLLVFIPRVLLSRAGILPPPRLDLLGMGGVLLALAGTAIACWCVLSFVHRGRGTPAPFDPPRELVTTGPYRVVRNPMYLGAVLALGGAAVVYRSVTLVAYAVAFILAMHLFIVLYEEPTLTRTFGAAYEAYCREVRRWWPRW